MASNLLPWLSISPSGVCYNWCALMHQIEINFSTKHRPCPGLIGETTGRVCVGGLFPNEKHRHTAKFFHGWHQWHGEENSNVFFYFVRNFWDDFFQNLNVALEKNFIFPCHFTSNFDRALSKARCRRHGRGRRKTVHIKASTFRTRVTHVQYIERGTGSGSDDQVPEKTRGLVAFIITMGSSSYKLG